MLKNRVWFIVLFCLGVFLNIKIFLFQQVEKTDNILLKMTISADKKGDYKVYYSESKQFTEEQSTWNDYLDESIAQEMVFLFPDKTKWIRIDFPESGGYTQIWNIMFQYQNKKIEFKSDWIQQAELSQLTIREENGGYFIIAEQGDPYIFLDISSILFLDNISSYHKVLEIGCKLVLCIVIDLILFWIAIGANSQDDFTFSRKKIQELYSYRQMIVRLVRRELRGRYKGSVLGFLWTFLNPLLQLIVYTMVFSVIMRNGIEQYYLFLFVALVPWMLLNSAMVSGSTCIISSPDMVKKIYFPREVLPIANTVSNFINMLLCFLVVFVVLIITGFGVNQKAMLYLPIIMLVEFTLTLGITLLTSALTVYMRDVAYILSIFVMAWQFLTPIMYSIEMVPEELLPIFRINPMTPIIVAYRDILYYKTIPDLSTLTTAFVFSMVILIIGELVFCRLQKGFCEEL